MYIFVNKIVLKNYLWVLDTMIQYWHNDNTILKSGMSILKQIVRETQKMALKI